MALDTWPAYWIHPLASWERPWVGVFRRRFTLRAACRVRVHATADERYDLWLDGTFVGRGSERGDRAHWHFETYDFELEAGNHVLAARVWALGDLAPWAQVSVRPGFLLCPEEDGLVPLLASGVARWDCQRLEGYRFESASGQVGTPIGAGPAETVDFARLPRNWNLGRGRGWSEVRRGRGGNSGFYLQTLQPVPWLRPAELPAQRRADWKSFCVAGKEAADWDVLWKSGKSLRIPAHSRAGVLVDLGDYVCGYAGVAWSGGKGAAVEIGWAESLRDENGRRVRGLEKARGLVGLTDRFVCDGRRKGSWSSLWWRSGRFLRIRIRTSRQPLTIRSLALEETRYPWKWSGRWRTREPGLDRIFSLCRRTLEMCTHETFMDCPFYEQLQYGGDTRLQCLLSYVLADDARLAKKAAVMFDASRRNPAGWTTDAYPSRDGKVIPPFSLWWIGMLRDLAWWRGEWETVHKCLAGMRDILEKFHGLHDDDGLLRSPLGWNFVDSPFPGGVPPGGHPGEAGSLLLLQYLLAMGYAEDVERFAGEPLLARMYRGRRMAGLRNLRRLFFDARRGLIADDPGKRHFSEQAQSLGLLAGAFRRAEKTRVWQVLRKEEGLTRVSAYFAHYLFEAAFAEGKADVFHGRLAPWRRCAGEGFCTTPEVFGDTRSECHAWSAHPLYHYLSGVLGVRPGAFGFATVRIRPSLSGEAEAGGRVAHPLGTIDVRFCGDVAEIELPAGLAGEMFWGGKRRALRPGRQRFTRR